MGSSAGWPRRRRSNFRTACIGSANGKEAAIGLSPGCGISSKRSSLHCSTDEHARGVGEIRILPFSGIAFEWLSDDVVVYQTLKGTTTVNLTTGAISEEVDPTLAPNADRPRAAFDAFPVGQRFGPWEIGNNNGVFTADDSGDVRCLMPLRSPDGSRVACTYTVTDRWAESSESSAAVIRVR
jgi:hypothetical protein